MRRLIRFLVVTLAMIGSAAQAQKHPNVALGFNPNTLYQLGELDSVNLFNRSVVVHIPIGPRYMVGGQLSYQLQAVHNTSAFDYASENNATCIGCVRSFPNVRSNAGLAWRVTLGGMIAADDPQADYPITTESAVWRYESPAGDEHIFAFASNPGPLPRYYPVDGTVTAADSSGLRMVKVSDTERVVEFPNGERHTFVKLLNSDIYEWRQFQWRLQKIEDAKKQNWISIAPTYDANGRESKWTITDSTGRTHTIEFTHSNDMETTDYDGQIVSKITLSAPADASGSAQDAVYTFDYTTEAVALPCMHKLQTTDPAGGYPPKNRPLLQKINLPTPEATAFEFTYNTTASCVTAGAIATMTLPTKGTISYQFGGSGLPVGDICGGSSLLPSTPSLVSKTVTTLDGSQTWNYVTSTGPTYALSDAESKWACEKCSTLPGGNQGCRIDEGFQAVEPSRWSRTTVIEPAISGVRVRRDHFFNIWKGGDDGGVPILHDATFGADQFRYGLPITAAGPPFNTSCDEPDDVCTDQDVSQGDSTDKRLLSTRVFANCTGTVTNCAATNLLRSDYMRFSWYTFGWEMDRKRTVFDDDTECQAATETAEKCWTETQLDDENGAGRFREQRLMTNFRRVSGSPATEATNTTAYPTWTQSMRTSSSTAWLLDTFTDKTRTDGTSTERSEFNFDSWGRLLGTRTWIGTVQNTKDLLTVFDYDGSSNVIGERYYGGDTGSVGTADCCTASGSPTYRIRNSYSSGVLSKSQYVGTPECVDTTAVPCAAILTTADYTIDGRSGLITKSKDSAEVGTTYEYDQAFRLKKVTPTGAATSSYDYTAATTTQNARVVETVKDTSNVVVTSTTYEFDGLGRPKRVSKSLPNGQVAVTQTDYDALGRTLRVSQPVEETTHPTSNTGSYWTSFTYDPFGRQLSVITPDAKTTSFAYSGVRKVARTSSIATTLTGSQNVTTFESYDSLGRLRKVEEAVADTSATQTTGGTVTTDYTYDVGDRVAAVAMTDGATAQDRIFAYDGRGFLSTETHPEQTGNTTYSEYDARGHARKRVNGGRTVKFTYDAAERLTDVAEVVGGTEKPLKKFVFSTANDGTDLQKGKLLSAVRYNETTTAGKNEVKETYTYVTPAGQLSKVTTRIDHLDAQNTRTNIQELAYQVAYDDLLLPKTLTMPTCQGCSTTNGLGSVTYVRTAGFLTSVPNFALFTYHPSGMVKTVTHESAPAATDTYDANYGLARPSSITFSGGSSSCATPTASTITSPTSVCAGSTGNTASVTQRPNITHTWTIAGGGTITSSTTGESITFSAPASGTVTLTVTATDVCEGMASSSKIIPITAPTASLTGATTIVRGGPAAQLNVTLTGTPPWKLTWSDGFVQTNVTTSTSSRTVAPDQTTTYTVIPTSGASCNGPASQSATVTVIPPPPSSVSATTQVNRNVLVTWNAVAGASGYQIERTTRLGATTSWSTIVGTTTSYSDDVPASSVPVTYIYYVRTIDAYGALSNRGPWDHATAATVLWSQAISDVTEIQANDIAELRGAIDALRYALFVSPAFGGTTAPVDIRATDFSELVTALSAARAAIGVGSFVYSGVAPPSPDGDVLGAHAQQLREALR